jgi:hypothetical protein
MARTGGTTPIASSAKFWRTTAISISFASVNAGWSVGTGFFPSGCDCPMLRTLQNVLCLIATSWAKPSTVEMSADIAVCGKPHTVRGIGTSVAEPLFQSNSQEPRL